MKCEKCGKEIGHLLVDTFLYDGLDTDIEQPIIECEHNAAYIETTQNWTCLLYTSPSPRDTR